MGTRICPVCCEKQSNVIKRIDMKIPENYHLPEHYNVVECQRCGFVYADTTATMEDYDWYYTHCNFYGDDSKDDNLTRYGMTEELLRRYCQKDSRMLDIGAGNGRFEVALYKNGYHNITGMDPSVESVERLKKVGISSYIGSIYSPVALDEENKYDCIFLFEVAEHLLLPGKGIENVKKLLKDDGVFIISVPDYSRIGDDKSSIANYFNLEHINYFSENSLDNLMNKYGLQRIDQKRFGIDLIQCYKNENVSRGIKKDCITKETVQKYFLLQKGKEERENRIIDELRENQREIVIWGTGSYVMSLIATTDLMKCNIHGFIDNNKIKQGREMYGYTIYSPEYLRNKNYLILICSMQNGEEIRVQLEEMDTENDYIVL